MRARGCERNVITFSSLISACERAGRCDLALGLWAEMRREGCRPNVVTYNALLGACAHGESARRRASTAAAVAAVATAWTHAARAPTARQLRRTRPAPTDPAARPRPPRRPCRAAGSWAQAAEVWDSLLASGVRPDAVTHSLLVSAYERGGQWRRCLQAFERMQQAGFRPDACAYNSVSPSLPFASCINAGLPPRRARPPARAVRPGPARAPRPAPGLMLGPLCWVPILPGAGAGHPLVGVGLDWAHLLHASHPLITHPPAVPDPCLQVLDALVGSGLVSAQAKAVQLLAAAHRQGHLRLAAVSAHESAATAHTYGAAFLTALRWLAELRCAAVPGPDRGRASTRAGRAELSWAPRP